MPAEEKVTRKLIAILSADVKGYSLLMANDEAYTIKRLEAYRDSMSDLIGSHSGRVVDAVGDNLLAEFSSAVDAVKCAVEIQKDLQQKNTDLPIDKRLEFRIGVNIGDVIQEGDRIYGNGVNVAARIEALAESGGICISRNAYSHVRDKLEFGYEYLGEHSVKNIKRPVRVYKVLMALEDAGKLIGDVPKPASIKWIWATAALVVIVITSIVWQVYQKMTEPDFKPASVEKMAYPLPEKPSIAVLPFNNLSDNPSQDYIAVGISENIISSLSNISGMFVIASDSTSTFKGKHLKTHQISEELGVRYVLEGSVQKSGNRVRVNTQLIDATSGHYIWSEKYDSELQDLFGLQDEITQKIIVELQVQLTEGEQARVSHNKTTNLEAWSYANKGLAIWMHISKENNAKAMELFKQAVELDPNYVWAWVRLAWTHSMAALKPGWSQNPSEHLEIFFEISKKVLAMDESDSDVHALAGLAYLWEREHEKAIAEGEKALVLGPTNAQAHVLLACSMTEVGRFDDVIRLVGRAMRLHPYYPAYYLTWIGGSYRMTGRYEEALTVYNQLLERSRKGEYPEIDVHVFLADLYAEMGKADEARAHAAEIFKREPEFSLKRIRSINTYDYTDPALLERRLKALRKAGIPDNPPLPLPEKPSIAVLPFDNLSDDPEQGYLADGLTDELIGDLANIKDILVISRNSTFTYKGKEIKIPDVAKELNVRYVLEGSVQRSGDRLRIRAQLIDGQTDHHVWAESYDGVVDNIFSLQDRITQDIVEKLAVKLTLEDMKIIPKRKTDNLEAYLLFLKGWQEYKRFTPDSFLIAITLFEQAIDLDPNYWHAYAALAIVYHRISKRPAWNTGIDRIDARALAYQNNRKAMNGPTSLAHTVASYLWWDGVHYQESLDEAMKAVSLNPNDPTSRSALGWALILNGRHREAVDSYKRAVRLDPLNKDDYSGGLGMAYYFMVDFQKAVDSLKIAIQGRSVVDDAHWFLPAAYAKLGHQQEAEAALETLRKLDPEYSTLATARYIFKLKRPKDVNLLIDGLSMAGMK